MNPDTPDSVSYFNLVKSPIIEGLTLVSTPIGNLGDITLRALKTLEGVDLIACEDTRVTGKLLSLFDIKTPMMSYHDHNAVRQKQVLVDKMKSGAKVALVSDAGTPLISDPGYQLVQACYEAAIPVTACPGASSVVTALSLSGRPSHTFTFMGFLPSKSGELKTFLTPYAPFPTTLIAFESAKRLTKSLPVLEAVLGDRPLSLCRELTKRHEEILRGPISEILATLETTPVKGEIVLVIDGSKEVPATAADLDTLLKDLLSTRSVKEAAQIAADQLNMKKRDVYQYALQLKNDSAQ